MSKQIGKLFLYFTLCYSKGLSGEQISMETKPCTDPLSCQTYNQKYSLLIGQSICFALLLGLHTRNKILGVLQSSIEIP